MRGLNVLHPLISIILTTYNSEKVIEATLNGIVQQSFPLDKVELIIVDDGSKDNTLNIIREFVNLHAKRFNDVKVVVHDKNYGVSRARNDGIKVGRGKYILILDHDVVMPGGTLKALLEYMEATDERVVAVIPLHNNLCSGTLGKWEYRIRKGRISKTNAITSCALMRRELIAEIGLYDESLGPPFTVYEDIEYGARALARGYEIHLLGSIEVLHNLCEGFEEDVAISQRNYFTPMRILIGALRSLDDSRYRHALKKYLNSSPRSEKLRWIVYPTIVTSTLPLLATSLTFKSMLPLLIWLSLTIPSYLDVLRYYWNTSTPHISIAYSAVAFIWRLLRSIMLLIPDLKRLIEPREGKDVAKEVSLYRLLRCLC